ncbi:phage major capsid protein [Myxococcus sp. K38C18041901]|uniref:phage major capsid protein n=1 Tax=Myxococcus guangdongensis TaxID=2906760 RepID=UPI0020A759D1|nr:phage major capsid protein [Myxococcus guangdongensis]MCP3060968.1 phage major capsid protein [Myxococcus guangdongensis]
MTPEQMQEMAKSLGPLVAAQMMEQAKGQRDGLAGLLGAKAKPEDNQVPGILKSLNDFGAYLKAVVNAGRNPTREAVLEQAKRFGGADVQKAVQESVFSSAGVLVPVQEAGEMIEFLRPDSVVLALGARPVPFKGELHFGKKTGSVTFKWIGEGEKVEKSQPSHGKVVLKAHKAMILADISNDLLRNPAVGDTGVAEDFREAAADGMDEAALNGDGQGPNPKGVLAQMDSAHSKARSGTSADHYLADVDGMVEDVLKANIKLRRPGFLLHPTRETALLGLKDGGTWIFRDEMLNRGTLRGFPYKASTRIAPSRILFGTWDQLLYGVDTELVLSEHDVRAEYDETTLRGICRGDFKLRHDKAFSERKGY